MTSLSPTAAQPGRQASLGGFVRWIEGAAYALLDHLERRAAIKTLRELARIGSVGGKRAL
jgi:hypothetical protein